jgi:lipoprotein-releasing system permease protein
VYKLFLTLRYLRKRRIAYFAIAAVMLCTAMVLIVMSVMGGFLDQLKYKARGLLGDIIIDNKSYTGFPFYEEFIADISKWPEIVKATPVLYSYGLLRFQGTHQTSTVRVVGLRLEDVYQVNAFKQSLFYERYYPGTTTLAEQQQPLLGFDPNAPLIAWHDEQNQVMGQGPRPRLPAPYQQALERSWAAGIVDHESPESEWTTTCRAAKLPPIVGVYQVVPGVEPPAMTGDPLPGIIIGRDILARRLPDGRYQRYWQFPRGCAVSVTLLPATETGTVDTPVKPLFRYVDDSRTGIYEIDSQHVYCDFALLQKLLHMDSADRVDPETGQVIGIAPARCSQIQIKIKNGVDPYALAQRLERHYHSFTSDPRFKEQLTFNDISLINYIEGMTWEQSQVHIIAPVEKERQLVTILFAIISLVAAVLVLCILYMIVLQKTRDIGIIKAIGGSSAGVAAIFVAYGAACGVVGSAIGSVIGYFFVIHINGIQDWLTALNPAWQVWDRSVYSFDAIPNTVRTSDMMWVVIAAVIISTVGSLAAAWRAGRMQPVEALRYE